MKKNTKENFTMQKNICQKRFYEKNILKTFSGDFVLKKKTKEKNLIKKKFTKKF